MTIEPDEIDKLRSEMNCRCKMSDAERRMNAKLAATWIGFFIVAALVYFFGGK